jgi:hypothetical protein
MEQTPQYDRIISNLKKKIQEYNDKMRVSPSRWKQIQLNRYSDMLDYWQKEKSKTINHV